MMIKKVVSVIAFRINEKGINFKLKLDQNIPQKLIGDDQRLAQIITNLLSNAVKFTPEYGSVLLHAQFMGNENNSCIIQVKVRDSGIGISPVQQKKLFQSFNQAENDTSRKYGGTGLGLAISKRIVELMNGDIWIESELGEGAAFTFNVKLGRVPDEDNLPVFIEGALNGSAGRNFQSAEPIRMLAVDDDPDTLEFFEILARRMNLVCDTAAGAKEALELVDRNAAYDICFIDLRMPVMNGIALTRAVTSARERKPVIIIISAYDWNPIEEDAKAAGVNGFLLKPLFASDVVACVNKYIGVQTNAESGSVELSMKAQGEVSGVHEQDESFFGHCILLAEDVEINREIVLTLLEPTRLKIDCAADGDEAVRLYSAEPEKYDMIFMDMQMPVMDGLEATRRIRAIEAKKAQLLESSEINVLENAKHSPRLAGRPAGVPIIAMTANVFKEDVERCIRAGMNDHVGKPIDYKEMLAKLKKYLGS